MNETSNPPAKWLRYLLYVGIAALILYFLGNFLPVTLSRWLGYVLTGVSVYLLYQLTGANVRYQKTALFTAAALILRIPGIRILSLIGSVCAIAAQYLEFHAHGELIQGQDPGLVGKWNSLFWIQFAVELIGGIAVSMIVAIVAASGEPDSVPIVAIATVAAAFISPVLKVLYLVYLSRTVKLLAAEASI